MLKENTPKLNYLVTSTTISLVRMRDEPFPLTKHRISTTIIEKQNNNRAILKFSHPAPGGLTKYDIPCIFTPFVFRLITPHRPHRSTFDLSFYFLFQITYVNDILFPAVITPAGIRRLVVTAGFQWPDDLLNEWITFYFGLIDLRGEKCGPLYKWPGVHTFERVWIINNKRKKERTGFISAVIVHQQQLSSF